MKNIAIGILLLTTLVLGSLFLTQNRKTSEAQATAASLQEKLAEAETRVTRQEVRTATLETRLHATHAKAVANADQVTQLEQAMTNQVQQSAKSANPIAEMFKSPEMRDLMKNQQRVALSGIIDKNYAAFFSGLNLPPEKSAALKDMILKKGLISAQAGVSLLAGDLDATQRADLIKQTKADNDELDHQIKDFVGEADYPQFQAYEKTIPDRMTMNMFKEQQASGPKALVPEQEAQLLAAMSEERLGFKFTTDFSDQSKLSADPLSFFTEEKMTRFQQESDQLLERYLTRAANILAPGQIESFHKFLVGQREMQSAGMKMAAKMFGGKSAGN